MQAIDVQVSEDEIAVTLKDGHSISVPLNHFPRLAAGTPAQRAAWELLGDGEGIHWLDLDEDLSVAALVQLAPPRTL